MKVKYRLLAVAVCLLGIVASASAATLDEKCTVIESVSGKYIYKNSAPLRSGGVGTPLIGFRQEPTLIMKTNNSSRRTTSIYAEDGSRLARCPWATAHGFSGGRFRCTIKTSSLRRAAVRNGDSASVFFQLKGTRCVEIPDAGRCYGSVLGLCNRLIR